MADISPNKHKNLPCRQLAAEKVVTKNTAEL
jgi:hypothetical protein